MGTHQCLIVERAHIILHLLWVPVVTGSHKLRSEAVIRLPNDSLTVTIESVVIEVLLLGIILHMLRRWLKVELILLWRHDIGLWWSHVVALCLTVQLYLYGL